MDLIPLANEAAQDHTTRIERFQSLQAGQFWRAQEDVPKEAITAGMVLLIESIRYVDDKPHTIILRAHPSIYDRRIAHTYQDFDGKTVQATSCLTNHRFLLAAFLDKFEFSQDAAAVRCQEMNAIQARINSLQQELIAGQSDPKKIAGIIENGLRQKKAAQKPDSSPTAAESSGEAAGSSLVVISESAATSMATGTVGDALQAGITEQHIDAMRRAADREFQIATVKAEWIQGQTQAIADTLQELTPFYTEQAAAALAQTEDVRTYVSNLMSGIASLDLYVGKNVEVMTIKEGEPAPVGEPLTFVQKKLVMDQELAVWADLSEWFDFTSRDLFFENLRKHPGLVAQIFPTTRCVLVMASTHRKIDYGHAVTNGVMQERNESVFLLVRNGENLHCVESPVESHLRAHRLFPTKDDQDRIFRGAEGKTISFEDVAYTDRLKEHELAALHYKRFLILACGLDHRLKLFGDFYPGPATLDFVSMQFQEAYCRFLPDDDGTRHLGAGRPSLSAWLIERNSHLQSGSRVLCHWYTIMNGQTAPGACVDDRNGYTSFSYKPTGDIEEAIAFKSGQSLCVNAEVKGITRQGEDRTFNCKIDLTKFDGVDKLGYLCLDAVSEEDLHWYIHNRASRTNFIFYIRFFKLALLHVRADREREAATRSMLAQALRDGGIAQDEEIPALVDQAVQTWRAANRGQQLPRVEDGISKKVLTSLFDQMAGIMHARRSTDDVADWALRMGHEPLRLVLSGKSADLVLYVAPRKEERDDRLTPHIWVKRLVLERRKDGSVVEKVASADRWQVLTKSSASETVLHEWEAASAWIEGQRRPTQTFDSFNHKQAVFKWIEGLRDRMARHLDAGNFEQLFTQWGSKYDELNQTGSQVSNPQLSFPIGLTWDGRKTSILCAVMHAPEGYISSIADEAAAMRVRTKFIRWYRNKEAARQSLLSSAKDDARWCLGVDDMLPSLREISGAGNPNYDPFKRQGARRLSDFQESNPTIGAHFKAWKRLSGKNHAVVFAPDVLDQDGKLALDSILGNKLPTDYEALTIWHYSVFNDARQVVRHEINVFPHVEARPMWASENAVEKSMNDALKPIGNHGYSRTSTTVLSRVQAQKYIAGLHIAALERQSAGLPEIEGLERYVTPWTH